MSESDFRMKKRTRGYYKKLSNISGYGGIPVKTFDTQEAHEGEEEDVEIIKNLKFYKKTRHYRQLQLADGVPGGSSDSDGGSHCSQEEQQKGLEENAAVKESKQTPEEPEKKDETDQGGSGPAKLMGLIRAKNWVTRQSEAFSLARSKENKDSAVAEPP